MVEAIPMTPPALPWLGLAGPTASGKTGAALAIAREAPALGLPPIEVISVDSALVYRGMDLGTAKPSAAELAEVPHHLIDVIEPTAAYSAAEFARAATALVGQIHARGALPLLVGGTMLYFKAWLDGIDPLPAADAGVRAQIDARAAQLGWPALHAELARVDPVTAARLAPGDSQRIQRALEVFQLSGQPLASLHTRGSAESAAPGWL
ncbi:MAG: tRNA (adenosine(37)-N6)-dimethylallyltransferase MiaA, partial [Leptothrix sp. (in: b-proteobacteria)]